MMEELKPCPFCGGEARLNTWTFDGDKFRIKCVNNGCKCGAETFFYNSEAKAVEAWNTRWERTCEIEEILYAESTNCFETDLSCGHHVITPDFFDYEYCPECGAKVEQVSDEQGHLDERLQYARAASELIMMLKAKSFDPIPFIADLGLGKGDLELLRECLAELDDGR